MFVKSELSILQQRMTALRQFIQVIMGPRQVEKTTLVSQLVSTLTVPAVLVATDGAKATTKWILY